MSDDVPSIIIGGGRIGSLLAELGGGSDAIVRRGEAIPSDPPSGPIYVCTRNDALDAIVEATPAHRRGDLVFMQNGMLLPFLEKHGLSDATQVLLYLAVAKVGAAPVDGITEVNPEGLTSAKGRHALAFQARLARGKLTCNVKDGAAYDGAAIEKHIWICSYMLIGALHPGATVGQVATDHLEEHKAMVAELASAAEEKLGFKLQEGYYERLAGYAKSVAHYPTAVKEFEWRNGWFYNISKEAISAGKLDPMPLHTAGLMKLGLI